MNVTSKVEVIDPHRAAELMKGNRMNRPLRRHHVKKLALAMNDGRWRVAQPILLNGDGTLLDGQHRLQAVIESGATIEMLVVRGVSTDSFDVIDQGVLRQACDLFAIRGGKNAVKACAIATSMILRSNELSGADRGAVATVAAENDTDIQRILTETTEPKYMQGSERAAFVIAAQMYGWDAILPLLARLRNQVFDGVYDPMNTLNRWMIEAHTRGRRAKTVVKRHIAYAAAVLAIRAALEGRTLQVLRPHAGIDFES